MMASKAHSNITELVLDVPLEYMEYKQYLQYFVLVQNKYKHKMRLKITTFS